MKLFGSLTAISFSPIVTIEPRRRKFHCPIKLRIPLPSGHRADTSGHLRLLCSITGGQSKAIWEDVTGSTPLTISDKCLIFTTTVSARFWLVHCQRAARCNDAARFAQELWRYLIQVPFMAKFVVFAKRRDISEAQVRVFCMTDDKEEKTLEVQEHYTLVARSRDVEVLDNQLLYLEFGGNLIPGHLNGGGGARGGSRPLVSSSSALLNEQLAFAFRAFEENRLAFACRLRDVGQEPSGRIAFMDDSLKYLATLNAQQRAYLSERRRRAVCTLGVQLPAMCVHYDNILGTPKRNSYYATARIGDLTLADIASELSIAPAPPTTREQQAQVLSEDELGEPDSLNGDYGRLSAAGQQGGRAYEHRGRPDWMLLAPKVGIPRDEVDFIAEHCGGGGGTTTGSGSSAVTPALFFLMHWYRLSSPDDRDQDLARGLLAIGRDDIAAKLNFPVEPKRISRSTIELLREIEAIPVRSTENLYGTSSELSGYATSGARNNSALQRASGSQSRGASLRRLDSQPSADAAADSFEQQRARVNSASGVRRTPLAQRAQAPDEPAGKYFSSGLRSAGQSFERDADYDGPPRHKEASEKKSEVPAIQVSHPTGSRHVSREETEEEDDDNNNNNNNNNNNDTDTPAVNMDAARESSEPHAAAATSNGPAEVAPRSQRLLSQQGDSNEEPSEQQRAQVERMAQSLVEDLVNDALEVYLRRELQQTAEEAVREALAAVGAGGDPAMLDPDEQDVESYSRTVEQTRISETITSTSSKPQASSKRQRRRKTCEISSVWDASERELDCEAAGHGRAPGSRSTGAAKPALTATGEARQQQCTGASNILQESAVRGSSRAADHSEADARASSSVRGVQHAQRASSVPESAGGGARAALNPDLDCSDYSGGSGSSASAGRARYCCAKGRDRAQRRTRRAPRRPNSSSRAGKLGEQAAGELAPASRAENSAELPRRGKTAFSCLRLRQRKGGGARTELSSSQTRSSKCPKSSCADACQLPPRAHILSSSRKRASELKLGPSETAQTATRAPLCCGSSASPPESSDEGPRCAKGEQHGRRSGPEGLSRSSKASSFGPKVRADLDFGGRSSREGCASALLAKWRRRTARLGAPKFKAARASSGRLPPGAACRKTFHGATPHAGAQWAGGSAPRSPPGQPREASQATDVSVRRDRRPKSGKRTIHTCAKDKQEAGLGERATPGMPTSGGGGSLGALGDATQAVPDSGSLKIERQNRTKGISDSVGRGHALASAAEARAQNDLDKSEWACADAHAAAAALWNDIELALDRGTKRTSPEHASVRSTARQSSGKGALICEVGPRAHESRATQEARHQNNKLLADAAAQSRAGAQESSPCCCCHALSLDKIHSPATCEAHLKGSPPARSNLAQVIPSDRLVLLAAGQQASSSAGREAGELCTETRVVRQVQKSESPFGDTCGEWSAARLVHLNRERKRAQSQFNLRAELASQGLEDSTLSESPFIGQKPRGFRFSRSARCSLRARNALAYQNSSKRKNSDYNSRRASLLVSKESISGATSSSTYKTAPSARVVSESAQGAGASSSTSAATYYQCRSTLASDSSTSSISASSFETAHSDVEETNYIESKERSCSSETLTRHNMVSFVELDSSQSATSASGPADRVDLEGALARLDGVEMDNEDDDEDLPNVGEDHGASTSSDGAAASTGLGGSSQPLVVKQRYQQKSSRAAATPSHGLPLTSLELDDELDEERLKRILAYKRLSEGNCGAAAAQHLISRSGGAPAGAFVCRKNSLHMIGESLPPVTEGEPMRHMSHHMSSQNMGGGGGGGAQELASGSCSSSSSASLRAKQLACKRNSQDDATASCSSSTSLDGGSSGASGSGGGLSRRRSSTVSQCSSVLSEGTRQQLNFDLSPDLPPDSSILEANAISPTDFSEHFERPASPEPSSLGADSNEDGSSSFDMLRPVSRMSQFYCDEIMLTASPDSTLGDSNDHTSAPTNPLRFVGCSTHNTEHESFATINQSHQQRQQQMMQVAPSESMAAAAAASEEQEREHQENIAQKNDIRDNLERIINHVSTVRVSATSGGTNNCRAEANSLSHGTSGGAQPTVGQKRAHTPFGLNVQRNKTTLMSPATPSPTAPSDPSLRTGA